MKLIDADVVVHWQSYDDEHETFPDHEGTIAEFLDAMTDEGCPECVNAVPKEIEQANKQAAYVKGYKDGQKDKYGQWVDAVSVVRCKNCKHRPIGTNRDDLEFPDDKCPCKCEDYWYSWKPSDDWFCGNGGYKDDE